MPKTTTMRHGGKKGKRSARAKASGKYAKQFAITERNRRRKRVKHLSLHPNDIQALAAFKELLPKGE